MGPSWGPLGASWAHFGSHFPPPRGGPGEAPGGHFWTFLGRPSRDLKNELLFVAFSHLWGLFSVLLFALCCLPCSVAGGVVHMQKLKIHWFLWVASHMRLVLATPEAINFQGGRVVNIGGKKSLKKGTTGPENKIDKRAFLRPKWLPKWTPEASRNVCTRRSATEVAKNASWGAPRAPPDDFGAIFLPHRYPGIIRNT